MKGLKDKPAIVTGGLGDLGYASAQRLIEEGCRVALFDLKPDTEGRAQAIGAAFHAVDISNESQVRDACASVAATLGDAAILVNCAAFFVFKSVDAAVEDWQRILSVNVMGTSLMAKHVVPQMKKRGGGSIVNFSSVSGFVGQSNFATYNATKFAIRGPCTILSCLPGSPRPAHRQGDRGPGALGEANCALVAEERLS